ncbi:MAG: SDR family oxidoreductase [Candidatus Omnitrophica bacterium]|nr:SDR family oxidoreductase [Candidatus Omnitrophota bacterium]
MKLLLVGASGVLGSRLYNDVIKKKWDILGTYCSHEHEGLFRLDLRQRKSIEKVFNFFNPEVVILAGGITDVDLCEKRPGLAEEVNIKGTLDVIKKTRACGARLVFLSTDYIFDGRNGPYKEEDMPEPVNIYGRTKLEAETAVRGISHDYLIIRTAQLYGVNHRGKNYAVKIIQNMRNNKEVSAAYDFYSTPTYAGALSGSIIKLIEKKHTGIFHIAGKDFTDRYSYVSKISEIFGLKKTLIKKVSLKDLHLTARRPLKAGLNTDKAGKFLGGLLIGVDKGIGLLKDEFHEIGYKV